MPVGYKLIGDRYAHRVIYERHIGEIPPGWVVHHKDGNKANNSIDNLEAMPRAEHQRLHAAGRPTSDAQKAAAAKTLESLRVPKPASCHHCGAGFTSYSLSVVGKFCSLDCRNIWRRNKFVPEQRQCLVCKSDYLATKRFQRYCCKKCNNRSTVRTYRTEASGGKPRRKVAELNNLRADG